MNNSKINGISEVICNMDKIETVTKVLNQTLFEDFNFNASDSKNLCEVLLREISYTKAKLTKIEEDSNC